MASTFLANISSLPISLQFIFYLAQLRYDNAKGDYNEYLEHNLEQFSYTSEILAFGYRTILYPLHFLHLP